MKNLAENKNSKPGKSLRSAWSWLLAVGVVGIIGASKLSFLSDFLRSSVHWISIFLILVFVVTRIKVVMDEMEKMRKVNEALAAEKPAKPARGGNRVVKKAFPAALYLISVSVFALGLSLIFIVPLGYQSYLMQSQASSWPHTMGEVTAADIIVDKKRAGSQDNMVQPRVLVQYQVNGRRYVAREIHFNQSYSWRSNSNYAREMINKYRPGAQVQVFYNPDEPSMAVLDTRADWFTYFLIVFGAVLALFGTYWFWLAIRDTYFFVSSVLKK